MKKICLFINLVIMCLNTQAQEDLSYFVQSPQISQNLNTDFTPLIRDGNYTYTYMGKSVLVSFKGKDHIEYHQDKQYHIKSTLKWMNDKECEITIEHSTLPDFPFKRGAKLHFKILKMTKTKLVYQSTLGKRSWKGKMKII